MSNQTRDEVVLVTGGSGYVGSWTIVALLQQGYRVRTTVRDLKREEAVRATVARQVDAGERLSFFAADLLSDAGWERAADGARFILHVASPMVTGQDLIPPAREGTLRVLKAGQGAGVERVVLTSSVVAALAPRHPDSEPRPPTDETLWTDLSDPTLNNYTRSKVLAEQAAWDFVRRAGGPMTLSTVLPSFIQGPVLGKDYSPSIEVVARMLGGRVPRLPRFGMSVVDVRDLVDLHLKAMRTPEAAGQRFVATSDFLWMTDMARILRERLGERAAKVPTGTLPDFMVRLVALFNADLRQMLPNLGQRREFSTAKAERMLDWHARPAAEAVIDCAESLLRQGLV